MAEATLLISSKNYSSWSLRGYLLAKLSGIDFVEEKVSPDDPRARQELLMRTSSILVPCLVHGEVSVWDTLAIAEYLNELFPAARMLPSEKVARAVPVDFRRNAFRLRRVTRLTADEFARPQTGVHRLVVRPGGH
jgi:glutathione S-transferase